MTRSSKKGPYVDPKVYKKSQKAKDRGDKSPLKIWSRSCTIHPDMVGQTFAVHTGKDFKMVFVNEQMVLHKFGEFAPTRTFRAHAGGR